MSPFSKAEIVSSWQNNIVEMIANQFWYMNSQKLEKPDDEVYDL